MRSWLKTSEPLLPDTSKPRFILRPVATQLASIVPRQPRANARVRRATSSTSTLRRSDEPGAARLVDPPAIGKLGVGHIVFGVDAAETSDFVELARGDHVARQSEQGILDVVVADLSNDAFAFGRFHHGAGILGIGRDRLFA